MVTVYADVLIVINIYVNFLLLKAAAKIAHVNLRFSRCAAASLYGSLFSLTFLLPQLNLAVNLLIKAFAAVTVVAIASGRVSAKRLFINTITFFAVNFIAAGLIYAVYSWLKPDFIHFNNGSFYFDFSLFVLVASTAAFYFLTCLIRYILDRIPDSESGYKLIVKYKDKIVALNGLADTGNSLVDFFSGFPVIVCGKNNLLAMTGVNISESSSELPRGFRLIPCSTISDCSLIPVFRPDEIIIQNNQTGARKSVEALIGFGIENPNAVFNPKLLKL